MKLSEQQSALFLAFLSLARQRGVPSRVLSRAIDRVGRGPDGSLRFKNSLRYIRLAMAPQVPLVPSWKKLTRQAVVLMGHLFDQLQRALIDQKPASELQAIRKQIEDLGNEVRVAGVVLGLLAPWKPRKCRKSGVIRLGPWTEDLHPRDDHGKFVSHGEIGHAASDPEDRRRLEAKVTNPDERRKLEAAIHKISGLRSDGHAVHVSQSEFKSGAGEDTSALRDHVSKTMAGSWDVPVEDLKALMLEDGYSKEFVESSTPEQLKDGFVNAELRKWAGSAGGTIPTIASAFLCEKMGLPYEFHKGSHSEKSLDYIRERPALKRAVESFGSKMYEDTQKWFADRGIKSVVLVRSGEPNEKIVASSWATNWGGIRHGANKRIVEAVVPVKYILSTPATGYGTLAESEMVVLPRPTEVGHLVLHEKSVALGPWEEHKHPRGPGGKFAVSHHGPKSFVSRDPSVGSFLDQEDESDAGSEINNAVTSEHHHRALAKEGGRLVGAMAYGVGADGSAEIHHLGSKAKGVGSTLVDDLKARHKKVVAKNVVDSARGFYAKHGFTDGADADMHWSAPATAPAEFDFGTLPDAAKLDVSTLSWDSVNPALRAGETNDLHKGWIDRADKLFGSHGRKLKKDAVLYRGLSGHVIKPEVGAEHTEAGYLRGSHLESEAAGFAVQNADGQVVKINVPKGSTVLPGDHVHEGEVYLPRSSRLRVTKVRSENNGRRVDGSYNVLHHIEADLLPGGAPAAEAVAPEFIPHRTSKHRPKDYVTVVADSKRLEAELAKAPSSYIPPGGVGSTEEITPGRLARFREFLKTGKPVEQPDAVWADSGMVALNDGRHRTRVLIDSGLKTIPLTVHKRDAAKVEEAVGRQGLLFGPSKQVKWRFPWIQTAIDFLSAKSVIPASAFAGLSLDEQQAAFTAPGIEDPSELRKLRDEIAGGVKEGESYANFQKRVGDGLALTRAQTETVFRTNIHQGYVGGFEQGTEAPAVVDAFPAVMLSATRDGRVRETHWELDGFCCLKTDPAYQVLLRALKDWNCRCNPIPMSLKQAEAVGLKTFKDLPEEVVKKYGAGLAPAAV